MKQILKTTLTRVIMSQNKKTRVFTPSSQKQSTQSKNTRANIKRTVHRVQTHQAKIRAAKEIAKRAVNRPKT